MVIQLSSMPVSAGNVPNSTRPKPEIMTPAALAQWCEAHCQSSVNAQEAKERSRAGATEQITPPPPPCRPRLTPTDHCRHVPGSRLQLNLAAAQYPDKACEMYATIKASCLSASLLALIQKSTPSTDHNCLRSVTTRIIQPCHMLLLYRRCKQHTSCVCQLSDLACLPMVVRISYFDSTAFFISWVVSQHISPLPTFTKPPPLQTHTHLHNPTHQNPPSCLRPPVLHTGMGKVSWTFVTSTPAKIAAVSLMPGRRSASSSGGRWLRCRWMWSPSGPHPRPSLISMVIDRDTTSRDARSFAVGAYLQNRDQSSEHVLHLWLSCNGNSDFSQAAQQLSAAAKACSCTRL